jgi:sphingomyelin phosphodiesterase acid-like 3
MHIPPGMDAYNSSTLSDCNSPRSLWKEEYADAFLATIAQYKNILRDSYAGHLHRDDFRVITDRGVPFLQMHIAPSISPIYLNNPAFEIGVYDKANGALADYAVICLRNYAQAGASETPDWFQEYDFRQSYHLQGVSPAGLEGVATAIRNQPATRAQFLDFYSAHDAVTSIVATKDWRFYSSAQTQIRAADFARCACPAPAVK